MKPFFLKALEHLTGLQVEAHLRNGRTVRGFLAAIYTRPRDGNAAAHGYEPAGITLQRDIPVADIETINGTHIVFADIKRPDLIRHVKSTLNVQLRNGHQFTAKLVADKQSHLTFECPIPVEELFYLHEARTSAKLPGGTLPSGTGVPPVNPKP